MQNEYDNEGDEFSTIRCSDCQRLLDEDAFQCPECGQFITDRDRQSQRSTTTQRLYVVVAILLVILFLFPLIGRLVTKILGR